MCWIFCRDNLSPSMCNKTEHPVLWSVHYLWAPKFFLKPPDACHQFWMLHNQSQHHLHKSGLQTLLQAGLFQHHVHERLEFSWLSFWVFCFCISFSRSSFLYLWQQDMLLCLNYMGTFAVADDTFTLFFGISFHVYTVFVTWLASVRLFSSVISWILQTEIVLPKFVLNLHLSKSQNTRFLWFLDSPSFCYLKDYRFPGISSLPHQFSLHMMTLWRPAQQ